MRPPKPGWRTRVAHPSSPSLRSGASKATLTEPRFAACMRSTRLALLAVGVGCALLGWATAGMSAVADDLSRNAAPAVEHRHDHDPHGHPGRREV
jgi:hypothetical protein